MIPRRSDEPLHVPDTSTWQCIADGQLWPCEPGRRRLAAQHAGRPDDLVTLMVASAEQAVRDLGVRTDEAAAAIHRHMVRWVKP